MLIQDAVTNSKDSKVNNFWSDVVRVQKSIDEKPVTIIRVRFIDDELEQAKKELFDMVYKWGYFGVVVDENCNAFQWAIEKVIEASR